MNTHTVKAKESKSLSTSNANIQLKNSNEATFQFVDNRQETITQKELQEGRKPVQRKIIVDTIDDGEPFEYFDFVPKHFNLSSAGKVIYKRWIIDQETTHQYATKEGLTNAIEQSSGATDISFGSVFKDAAAASGVNLDWLEQYLTDLGGTLLVLNQESVDDIVEKINVRAGGGNVTIQDVEGMTLRELMDVIFDSNILSQSCGQTANLIHEFISGNYEQEAPKAVNIDQIITAFREANTKSVSTRKHQYVKVEGGGHAFVVEVYNDEAKIFQSFFGRYSFAKDLQRNKSYPLGQFIPKFKNAMADTAVGEEASGASKNARRDLFSSEAVHPDGNFNITMFTQNDDSTEERVTSKFAHNSPEWNTKLGEDATDHLKQPLPLGGPAPVQAGPSNTVMEYDFENFLDWTIMEFPGSDDVDVNSGNLPIGTIGVYGGYDFRLTSKTNTMYRFDYIR